MAEFGHNFGMTANWPVQVEFVELMKNDEHFEERLRKLISGLDKDSVETVYRIISRLRASISNQTYLIKDLNKQEINVLNQHHSEFYPNIFEVIPGKKYYYNGYYLPANKFATHVFWDHLGLKRKGVVADKDLNAEANASPNNKQKETITPPPPEKAQETQGYISNLEALKNKDIIDVGAYIGDSALILLEYTNKKVYAFEAILLHYKLMLETIKQNNATRIVPVYKGLGAKSSKERICIADGGSSIVLANSTEYEEIDIITLDSYVKANKIKVGFIKVDIEGFEQEFLKGAKETIKSQKPAMAISLYHSYSDFFDIKPLLESWNLGYRFKIGKPIDHNVSAECVLFCEVV